MFDFGARGFHQPAVVHARRAGDLAAAAGQAQIDVFDVGRADGRARGDLGHLVDASARRIHLQAQLAIGGAGVQAQATMDAAVQIGLLGPIVRDLRYDCRAVHG